MQVHLQVRVRCNKTMSNSSIMRWWEMQAMRPAIVRNLEEMRSDDGLQLAS